MKEEEVKELIGKENWHDFLIWMLYEPVSVNKDGSNDYYIDDVNKYQYYHRKRGKEGGA